MQSDTGGDGPDTGPSSDADADGFPRGEDCDDEDGSVHPGAAEACNGADDDCDGEVDEGLPTQRFWLDLDGDGYAGVDATDVVACAQPSGTSLTREDCDDSRSDVHPGAAEVLCDGVDNDCDGSGAGLQAMLDGIEYATLERAVADAGDGDTVYVCVGTHDVELAISHPGIELTLAGYTGDAGDVVLDGNGTHRILDARGPARLTLRDLTFANGFADGDREDDVTAGAVRMDTGALLVESCAFVGNAAPAFSGGDGGAIRAMHADLEVRDSSFSGNMSGYAGGAIAFYVSPYTAPGVMDPNEPYELLIEDSAFDENESYEGSAVVVNGRGAFEARFSRVAFDRNAAKSTGAVDISVYEPTTILVEECSFSENSADIGGALSIYGDRAADLSYALDVSDTTFTDNVAGAGGAVHLGEGTGQSIQFDGCVFDGNVATYGGAVVMSGGNPQSVAFVDTQFVDNTATAGGVFDFDNPVGTGQVDLALEACEIEGNTASMYGGVGKSSANGDTVTIAIANSLISGNAAGVAGGGFWFQANTTLTSTSSDWSDGTTSADNSPDDVFTLEGGYSFSTEDFVCADGLECL